MAPIPTRLLTDRAMDSIIERLEDCAGRFEPAAAQILQSFELYRSRASTQAPVAQLVEGITQFLAIAAEFDAKSERQGPRAEQQDAGELGDYALNLLMELTGWTAQLGLEDPRRMLDSLTLSVADWVIRHHGRIQTLETVVDALANTANRLHDPIMLERLAEFINRLVAAVDEKIKQDLETSNPARPWRILLLNRGIVATRSYNIQLMEQAYDELAQYLPDETGQFFAKAMQQMEILNYPAHVRELVARYYHRFTRQSMH